MQSGQCLNGHRPMSAESIEAKGESHITGGLSKHERALLHIFRRATRPSGYEFFHQALNSVRSGDCRKLFLIKLITGCLLYSMLDDNYRWLR